VDRPPLSARLQSERVQTGFAAQAHAYERHADLERQRLAVGPSLPETAPAPAADLPG